ncbi:MAG: nicotinate-nucleotide--dimethylbenzimidazole phosphoribosyltransferase [Deltaproteobacteria bacterium]|jgi:nicotinate-nucleotide--dimethylbenzimidazole phosphoribosyltransferase|nr:nicotinate-nucleotide--dimethylbenzimidazole phosphoribosyltransferase [Deltaproteobacteria bacterium]
MDLENSLAAHLSQITPPNMALAETAAQREASLAKPPGSLGRLEGLAIQLSAIQSSSRPRHENKLMVVCAADHGVVEEGISPYPKDVTRQQIENFSRGGGAITTLCRTVGARVLLLDVGVDYQFEPNPMIINKKIAFGTKNLAKGPAMSRQEALKSLLAGIEVILAQPELDLVAAGEMGIGNTTPSSCICSVFTGLSPETVTGRGSGLREDRISHKVEVVRQALEINKPNPLDPIDVLAKVGGFEIGAMAGIYLGAAIRRAGIIIDGFIAGAAATIADKLSPGLSRYFIAGHKSQEPAHQAFLDHLHLRPLLDLSMWLGEGSGAAISMFLAQCAVTHFNEMRTLEEARIADPVLGLSRQNQ